MPPATCRPWRTRCGRSLQSLQPTCTGCFTATGKWKLRQRKGHQGMAVSVDGDTAAAMTLLQVFNTGRLARCVQEDAQEAVAGVRSAQHQLADRLAILEEAVEGLPRSGDRLTVNVRP